MSTGGYLEDLEIRYFSVTIPSAWQNTAIGNEIIAAITAWNSNTSETFASFSYSFTSDGNGGDISFGQGGGASCGSYSTGNDKITLHYDLVSAASTYPDQVRQVILHEIGHVLGLGESTETGSVMTASSYPSCSSGWIAGFPTTGIQGDDASSAGTCVRDLAEGVPDGGTGDFNYNGVCWEYWVTTLIFSWSPQDGWEIIDSYSTYQFTTCTPPY